MKGNHIIPGKSHSETKAHMSRSVHGLIAIAVLKDIQNLHSVEEEEAQQDHFLGAQWSTLP